MGQAAPHLLSRYYVARRTTGPLEPGLELGHLHDVKRGLPHLDAQRSGVERRLAAPIAAPESLQGQRSRLVQTRGGNLSHVLHALIIAEADDALARLAHRRSITHDSPYVRLECASLAC
jgi:hypothetical protein